MMEEKTVEIISKLDQIPNGPFQWSVKIENEKQKLCSWDSREFEDGETYTIMLLDEDKNDITYNQRRMSKKHEPKLYHGVEVVEEVEAEIVEEEPTLVEEEPKKEKPKKETPKPTKTETKDDFEDEFGGMIEDAENDKAPVVTNIGGNLNTALTVPEGSKLDLSYENIKEYISPPNITKTEIYMFMQLCINQGLNPFIGDAYLVKYGTKAQMIVSKDAFMKKAEQHANYSGFQAGIIIANKEGSKIEQREGALILPNWQLVGGWARIHREGMNPFYMEVSFAEYNTGKAMWKTKPGTMIRKVALVQAMREAFPAAFQGMYDGSEVGVEEQQ